MNSRNRAEKIEKLYGHGPLSNKREELLAILDEAEREACHDCTKTHKEHKCSVCYAEGFRAGSIEGRERGLLVGFIKAREKAKEIVEERMEQNAIATNLYALPENKLAKAVEAWMFDVAQRIGEMEP